ncbi:MAG: nickel insertion protein [Myxococcaceae bacterium]
MLHFDLSQGCTARALCASLLDLGASLKAIEEVLPKLQIRYVDQSLDFLDHSGRSLDSATQKISLLKRPRFKAKLKWHHAYAKASAGKPFEPNENIEGLSPIPAALFHKSQRLLLEAGHVLTPTDTYELISFCVLLTNLDPKALSATRVPLSFDPENPNRDVLLKLSESVPVYEKEWPGPTSDPVGLALIKTCVSNFGTRGESRLIKMGLGFSPEVRALWCEPVAINTRSVANASTEPRVSNLIQITAFIPEVNYIGELTHRLHQVGVKKLWTSQVQDQGTHPKTLMTVIASEADQNKMVEALLVLGGAPDIQLHLIEQHSLQKRTVSVTLGRTQKLQVCRVVESLWGDKVLRADPLPEDLASISKATATPQEIVRADVLSAWKNRKT